MEDTLSNHGGHRFLLDHTTPSKNNHRCHLGRVLKYDTVTRLGWAVDIRAHGIRNIVERLLAEDWEPPIEGGVGREVPEFSSEEDCVVCIQ